jgi:hypothetical protein
VHHQTKRTPADLKQHQGKSHPPHQPHLLLEPLPYDLPALLLLLLLLALVDAGVGVQRHQQQQRVPLLPVGGAAAAALAARQGDAGGCGSPASLR